MSSSTDPQFIQAIGANLTYWQQFVAAHQDQPSLSIEHDGLRRAVEFGMARPETAPSAAALALAAFPLVLHRGYWQAWLPIFHCAIADQQNQAGQMLCQLLNRYGQLLRLTEQLETAVAIHQQAEATASQSGDSLALAEAHFNLSEDYRRLRRYDLVETYGDKAWQILLAHPDTQMRQAALLNNLGLAAQETGQLTLAGERVTQAITLWRLIDNPTELSRSLNNLGIILQAQEKFDAALPIFLEAIDVLACTASELDKSRVQLSLGVLYFQLENYEQASAAFKLADTPALRQSGDYHTRAILAQNMGNALLKQGRYAQAERYLRRSLNLWQSLSYPVSLANTMGTLAEVLGALDDVAEACLFYDQALALLTGIESARAHRLQVEFAGKRQALAQEYQPPQLAVATDSQSPA